MPSRSEITRNPRSASCSAELLLANFFRRSSSTSQPNVERVGGSVIQMALHTPLLLLEFEGSSFTDWFPKVLLPDVKKL
jgi:hypothetical protein